MKSQTLILDAIATIILFLLTVFTLLMVSGEIFSTSVHFLFLVIVFQSIALMTFIKSPILKMYYTFSYLFYGVIPYLEQSRGISSYWGLPPASPELLSWINIILFFLNFTVLFSYRFSGRKTFKAVQSFYSSKNFVNLFDFNNRNIRFRDNFYILFFICLLSTLLVLYINNFSILNLMFRDSSLAKAKVDGVLNQVIESFIRPIPAVTLIFYLIYKPKNYKIKSLLLLPLCLITVFPTGVPRFYAAAIYLPILILLYKPILKGNRLNYFIIASIFITFPLLNNFRRLSDSGFSLKYDIDFLFEGHFDSYLSISQVIQSEFITYGRQLLGSLLFFVPRSIWENKPTGTGYTLVKSINQDAFANVSANYYSEGYANFGYIGMICFAVALGIFFRKADEVLTLKLILDKGPEFLIPFYLLLVSFLFFFLRGDLLSSFSFLIGFLCCIVLCSFFFKGIKIKT